MGKINIKKLAEFWSVDEETALEMVKTIIHDNRRRIEENKK